ncbi:hypothetical protein [Acrocarpospora sp. B8E8]|uniref:hypothetical protein n=1 Tax=Acrocarpospora sp. B8E8 TaxID=3153572 RepID=UPI00325F55AC
MLAQTYSNGHHRHCRDRVAAITGTGETGQGNGPGISTILVPAGTPSLLIGEAAPTHPACRAEAAETVSALFA